MGQKVALDASPLIYYLDADSRFLGQVRPVMEHVAAGGSTAVVSTLVVTEVETGPADRRADDAVVAMYKRFFRTFPNLALREVDLEVSELAAELRRDYGMRTPDAVIGATALIESCDILYTNDPKFKELASRGLVVSLVGEAPER